MAPSPTPQDFNYRLGQIVARALTEKGIPQRDASDLVGIPYTTWRRHMKGNDHGFKSGELHRIAALLETTVSALTAQAEAEVAA